MSQLFDHGGFGYDAIRVCLQQQNTEDLYSRWLFGLGEAPVSGSGEQSDAAAAPAQTSDEEKNTPQEPETTSEGSEAPEENGRARQRQIMEKSSGTARLFRCFSCEPIAFADVYRTLFERFLQNFY